MLPRSHRLSRKADILRVIRTGSRISVSHIVVHVSPVDIPYLRIACVVGKRVYSKATDRHRLQRHMREIAHELVRKYPSAPYDMVWVAQPSIASQDAFQQLKESVITTLEEKIFT